MKGQAAMIVDGNWDTATLQQGLGKNLAPFVPPFASGTQKGVVQYPGDGFSVSKLLEASERGRGVPQVPDDGAGGEDHLRGRPDPRHQGLHAPTNPLSNQMLDFAAKQGFTPYPMIDNVIQGEVVTTAQKQLVAALGGDISVQTALGEHEVDARRAARELARARSLLAVSTAVAQHSAATPAAKGRRRSASPLAAGPGSSSRCPVVALVASLLLLPIGQTVYYSFTTWDGFTLPVDRDRPPTRGCSRTPSSCRCSRTTR